MRGAASRAVFTSTTGRQDPRSSILDVSQHNVPDIRALVGLLKYGTEWKQRRISAAFFVCDLLPNNVGSTGSKTSQSTQEKLLNPIDVSLHFRRFPLTRYRSARDGFKRDVVFRSGLHGTGEETVSALRTAQYPACSASLSQYPTCSASCSQYPACSASCSQYPACSMSCSQYPACSVSCSQYPTCSMSCSRYPACSASCCGTTSVCDFSQRRRRLQLVIYKEPCVANSV